MQCFCRRFGLLFQIIAKVALEKVVTELKLVKIVVTMAVMVTFQRSFSAITSPIRTVNDR